MATPTGSVSGVYSVSQAQHPEQNPERVSVRSVRNSTEEIATGCCGGCWQSIRSGFMRAWKWIRDHLCCTSRQEHTEDVEGVHDQPSYDPPPSESIELDSLASFIGVGSEAEQLNQDISELTEKIKKLKKERSRIDREIKKLEKECCSCWHHRRLLDLIRRMNELDDSINEAARDRQIAQDGINRILASLNTEPSTTV